MHSKKLIKQALINDGLDKEINHASWLSFCGDDAPKNSLIEAFGLEVWLIGRSINRSLLERRLRAKKRIAKELLIGHVQFLTLTFTDECLRKTSKETRRKYVRRFLKKYCSCYIANIDYGGKNGREHYHAVVVSEHVEFKEWHKYGAIKTEKVRDTQDDSERLARYITKLARHSYKSNEGMMDRMLYSRNTKNV